MSSFSDDEKEEIGKIKGKLMQGENVVIVGKQGRGIGGSMSAPNTVFVTNKRVLIKDPSSFGMRETIHTLDKTSISSVAFEKGMLKSALVITGLGGKVHEISGLSKEKGEEVEMKVNELLSSRGESSGGGGASSAADELKKLASLRDDGILSKAEFDEQKKKLLG